MLAVRPALPSDAEAIFVVHMASIRALASSHYSQQQIDAWCGDRSPRSYVTPIETKFVLVATENNAVCGFAQFNPVAASIEAVYVAPECVRRGIGMQLLCICEAHAQRLGIAKLTLSSSLNAVAFYASAGYCELERTNHELRPGVSIPCVTMRKPLHTAALPNQ